MLSQVPIQLFQQPPALNLISKSQHSQHGVVQRVPIHLIQFALVRQFRELGVFASLLVFCAVKLTGRDKVKRTALRHLLHRRNDTTPIRVF
jgi:hypothetical protein